MARSCDQRGSTPASRPALSNALAAALTFCLAVQSVLTTAATGSAQTAPPSSGPRRALSGSPGSSSSLSGSAQQQLLDWIPDIYSPGAAANASEAGKSVNRAAVEAARATTARQPPADECKPYPIPGKYKGLQHMCSEMFKHDSGKQFDDMYRGAIKASPERGFPLRGCVVGCVVGNNAGAIVASSPRNADLWSGKCFDKWGTNGLPTGVTNAITLGKELIDWHKGLPGFLQFAGDMRLGSSLVDGQPTWLIDYTDAEPLVGHDFRGFTDELREVEPGFMVGKVFIKPGVLPYNPTTDVMDALHFALFQTCDKSGRGYAHDPNQRYVP